MDIITETTCELDRLTPTILELLDRRATALANCGQLERALQDSDTMRVPDPSSARGYLIAGDIHATQGHPHAAIVVSEDGLRHVPVSDPQYALLEQTKFNAEHNARINVSTP